MLQLPGSRHRVQFKLRVITSSGSSQREPTAAASDAHCPHASSYATVFHRLPSSLYKQLHSRVRLQRSSYYCSKNLFTYNLRFIQQLKSSKTLHKTPGTNLNQCPFDTTIKWFCLHEAK